MCKIEIEKNVPIPSPQSGGRNNVKYPWEEMEEGDSFLIDPCHEGQRQNILSSGLHWCRLNQPKLRVISRKEGSGFRFWLIER